MTEDQPHVRSLDADTPTDDQLSLHQSARVFHARLDDVGANRRIGELGVSPALFFEQALEQTRMAICVSDPRQADNPIVFVNNAFELLTGYDRSDIVGRNCRFLQGERTNREGVARLREAIEAEETCVVELLNYRKDGTAFWNSLHVGPIYGADGKLALFYGSQWDVTDLVAERERAARQMIVNRELHHRLGNLFGIIGSILRISKRKAAGNDAAFEEAEARISALARAHQATISPALSGSRMDGPTSLRGLLRTVLNPYGTGTAERVGLEGDDLQVSEKVVSSLGLAVHELATNAVKYGSLSVPTGRVRIAWTVEEATANIIWTEIGGPTPVEPEKAGTGTRLIEALIQQAGGRLERSWNADGLVVRMNLLLDLPGKPHDVPADGSR